MPNPLHSVANTEAEPATPDGEIARLRQCIEDLMSMQSLPALWSGRKPSRVVGRLLKLAVRPMLHLEFAYARLADSTGGVDIEAIRCAHRRHQHIDPRIVRKPLEPWLSGAPTAFSSVIANPLSDGTLSIAATPFGPQTGTGMLVAAAARPAFPTEVEMLLLSVAASKATIVVHEARLVDSHSAPPRSSRAGWPNAPAS